MKGRLLTKPTVIAGVVLAVLGAFILFGEGISLGSERNVMKVGDMEVSTEQRSTIPDWAGGLAIVGGVLLVGAGVRSGSEG